MRVALLFAAAAAAGGSLPHDSVDSFGRWLIENGGAFAPTVAVSQRRESCSESARLSIGVVTRTRLPKESVVVTVPHQLLLWPSPTDVCTSCTAYERLALRLLEERSSSTSKFRPYLDVLPERIDNALSFSRSELSELRGTYAGTVVSRAREHLAAFVSKVKGDMPGLYTDEALRWALGVVLSRSFVVGRPSSSSPVLNGSSPLPYHYDTPFLAPGADMLNHGPAARVGWTFRARTGPGRRVNGIDAADALSSLGPESFGIVQLSPLAMAGQEVLNSYDPHATGAHTLAYYGFAVEQNPWEAVVLRMPLYPSGSLLCEDCSDLLSSSLISAQQSLTARLLSLASQEGGGSTGAHARLALSLLPAPPAPEDGAGTNVTVVLHRPSRGGGVPTLLLNAARVAALSLPATQQWLEAHARAYGLKRIGLWVTVNSNSTAASATPSPTPVARGRGGRGAGTGTPSAAGSSGSNSGSTRVLTGYTVLVPASATEEISRVEAELKNAALQRVSSTLQEIVSGQGTADGGMEGASGSSSVPAMVAALAQTRQGASQGAGQARQAQEALQAFAVNAGTGRLLSIPPVGVDPSSPSSLRLPSLLTGSTLNTSLLVDLLSHRVLLSSIRRLLAGYPASLKEDKARRGHIQQRMREIEAQCGISAAFPSKRTRSAQAGAAAAAAASAMQPASGRRLVSLTFAEERDLDAELSRLRTLSAILTVRIAEQEILVETLAAVSNQAGRVATTLAEHGVKPLEVVGGAAGGVGAGNASSGNSGTAGWEESWSLDLPDIDGYYTVPALSYSGEHVHEEESEEGGAQGQGQGEGEQGQLEEGGEQAGAEGEHAQHGHLRRHASSHAAPSLPESDLHVSMQREHTHAQAQAQAHHDTAAAVEHVMRMQQEGLGTATPLANASPTGEDSLRGQANRRATETLGD